MARGVSTPPAIALHHCVLIIGFNLSFGGLQPPCRPHQEEYYSRRHPPKTNTVLMLNLGYLSVFLLAKAPSVYLQKAKEGNRGLYREDAAQSH